MRISSAEMGTGNCAFPSCTKLLRTVPGTVSTTRKDFASGVPSSATEPRSTSSVGISVSRSPSVLLLGGVKVSRTLLPTCRADKSLTATGIGGKGGAGSPGAPQPATNRHTQGASSRATRNRDECLGACDSAPVLIPIFHCLRLEDVTAEILVLDDVGELLVHVARIDLHRLFFQVRRLEGKLIQHLFENRMQPARPDILCLLVHAGGEPCDRLN